MDKWVLFLLNFRYKGDSSYSLLTLNEAAIATHPLPRIEFHFKFKYSTPSFNACLYEKLTYSVKGISKMIE